MKNENINEIAKKLREKNTWIRKELKNFFEIWRKIDFGEKIYQEIYRDEMNFSHGIVTGYGDIVCLYEGQISDWKKDEYFSEGAEMSSVRDVCNAIPDAIEKIREKARKRIEFQFELKTW